MSKPPDSAELLVDYARLINEFGVDSTEAAELLDRHRNNDDFRELAETSRMLKGAIELTP
jgi:hypothetical protein